MGHAKKTKKIEDLEFSYHRFDKIDGRHSLQKDVPRSHIKYKVSKRKGAKVSFFHFDLAKEIGLIPENHPEEINKNLRQKIIDTFAIVIINEFDKLNEKKYDKSEISKHHYMATRYLQLQHTDNLGNSSGDGRSVWNGQISHKGKTWDLSSCGTGATRLSPATNKYKKFFETGDPAISYGCGYCDIDEGYESLFFSEVFHRNHYPTERILCILEYDNNTSIVVRANPNLLRPSHFFVHLKQNDKESLRQLIEYYIQRQEKNSEWENVPKRKKERYQFFLNKVSEAFARISARFEDDYVFCWMDWDGDNILMDGGIIDYGSIRQFGLYHHSYRFDDDDRFSTNIKEQKMKAKYIVQTFCQVVDFVIYGEKKPIKEFSNSKTLRYFDHVYSEQKDLNLLYRIGISPKYFAVILEKYKKHLDQFRKAFNYFEMAQSKSGPKKVSDGVNHSAIYCIRDILRELPQLILVREEKLSADEFLEVIQSSYATKKDLEPSEYRNRQSQSFQRKYLDLLESLAKEQGLDLQRILLEVSMRSSIINRYDRVTGDSVTHIVKQIVDHKKMPSPEHIFQLVNAFTDYQDLNPEMHSKKKKKSAMKLDWIFEIVREMREGI